MKFPVFFCFFLGLTLVHSAKADTTLEYQVNEAGAKQGKLHSLQIKEGMILLKDVDVDGGRDFLYSAAPEQLFILDHHKHSFMSLDENQINHFAKQTETVQPLLKGFGEQIARLDPKQRAKWESLIGDKVSLDNLAAAAKPAVPVKLVKTGVGRKVGGFACEQIEVYQGKTKSGQLCLADPGKLNMSALDYATLRGLLGFSERLVSKTQGLARQFGVDLPLLELGNLAGVPVEIIDASQQKQSSLRLSRVLTQAVSAEGMQVPTGYQGEPFKLWK